MARRTYTDEDRSAVYAALLGNEGNVKRTSRETGVAEQTVRDWKKLWEKEGGPPPEMEETASLILGEHSEDVKRVRDLALLALEEAIQVGNIKGAALVTAFGVLFDKARILDGLATSRKELVTQGPTPQEIGEAVQDYLHRTLAASTEREVVIEDADWTEQAEQSELPSGV